MNKTRGQQKKKRAKPLPIETAIERLGAMVELVERELRTAIQLEMSLETANNIVKAELHGHRFYGAECYDTVKLATQLYLAIVLAKLFEEPRPKPGESIAKKANRSDVASIPLMLRLLGQKRCVRKLVTEAGLWQSFRSSADQTNAAAAERHAAAALSRYRELRRSRDGGLALAKLSAFRNEWLAHLLLKQSEKNVPKYDQLFLLVDAARDIIGATKFAVKGSNLELTDWEKERSRISNAFWNPALIAARDWDREPTA
ncbi:MAG: hypothetical protein EOR30_17235 [Mesorhizobium sp.]|uniref:AbiU2 domain-containing protein n=1 Tax=unclassified Mesorhizobium TaxID=325217 RepID=UPI000FCB3E09|nr:MULTISPECIES: hypothetical protein [unclassified Mesorhizobium]RUV75896.1 hypothetical protein EOA78_04620 [Mesorhizobium sp. M5C.F.Cr.IN.023.01.1.1]RWF54585.1 MAG: hypothetical protein EOS50_16945 [Mesorhizobium sp.]RWF85607.1 MAG: hypothetical protein EOQ36_21640 [Mesorhizobium sp.]RWF95314.1 MAG: hypothetical protein EOQ45_08300 [Mesorhizobium sp.]RWI39851.1 MAG: hypothetical protein EOR14_17350 [Mesorhizobium sp.]